MTHRLPEGYSRCLNGISRCFHGMVQAEWLRMRNEQMSMRMRSSLAGGLGGARGYGDVAMLSRANTQVRNRPEACCNSRRG